MSFRRAECPKTATAGYFKWVGDTERHQQAVQKWKPKLQLSEYDKKVSEVDVDFLRQQVREMNSYDAAENEYYRKEADIHSKIVAIQESRYQNSAVSDLHAQMNESKMRMLSQKKRELKEERSRKLKAKKSRAIANYKPMSHSQPFKPTENKLRQPLKEANTNQSNLSFFDRVDTYNDSKSNYYNNYSMDHSTTEHNIA